MGKLKGKLKQIEGKLTGDKVRMAQGTVEKTSADIASAATRVGRTVEKASGDIADAVSRAGRKTKRALRRAIGSR